jgi:predicted metal-binding membrane protein
MNLLWIGAITAFVLLEKVLPRGEMAGRISGFAMIALGAFVLGAGAL